ncbi:hypothetical protein Q7P37_000033 [Cladosporium fusiforme]
MGWAGWVGQSKGGSAKTAGAARRERAQWWMADGVRREREVGGDGGRKRAYGMRTIPGKRDTTVRPVDGSGRGGVAWRGVAVVEEMEMTGGEGEDLEWVVGGGADERMCYVVNVMFAGEACVLLLLCAGAVRPSRMPGGKADHHPPSRAPNRDWTWPHRGGERQAVNINCLDWTERLRVVVVAAICLATSM